MESRKEKSPASDNGKGLNLLQSKDTKIVEFQNQKSYKFSVFKQPITNTIPLKTVSLNDVYTVVISDKYKAITEELRQASTKDKQSYLKTNKLDYVTFSGVFAKRATEGLETHSGLFSIDLDNINNIEEVKSKIIELLAPSLLFVSPSGKGLKVVYKINIDEAEHLEYYDAFEQFFRKELNIEIDEKCKDVARACFLCYDNKAYYNNEAPIIARSFVDTFSINNSFVEGEIKDYDLIINNLKTWLNKNESFTNGNRNNYVTQLASACNRYGVPQYITESNLTNYAENGFTEAEIKATIKSIYSNTKWYNTASFDTSAPYEFTQSSTAENTKTDKTPLLPIDGFPELLQSFINEYVEVYNTPRDFISASVLFSTAFAIGDKLELKDKYDNIPILWMALIGDVSSGKTKPLETCLDYFKEKDNTAFKEYEEKKNKFEVFNELSKKEKENQNSVLNPEYFQYILNDYTPEALYNVHKINKRGVCIYRDELKGWLDDFGRYNKSGEQSTMLSTFFRQSLKINRAGKEPINISNPAIYSAGGLQPELLKDLAKDNRAENGFLSRFIFAYPDKTNKPPYSKKRLKPETINKYYSFLKVLSSLTEKTELTLSNEAEILYSNWFNENAKKTNDESSGYLKGVYGKLDVISLRIAIVLYGMDYVCSQNTNNAINENTMKNALDITEYFRATALKVYYKIFNEKANSIKNADIIKHLSVAIEKKVITQTELAKILNVNQAYVSKVLKSI